MAQGSFPSAIGLVFPAPLSNLGSSVLTFFSPFGFFVLLQVSIVNLMPWETLLHLRHGVVGVHGTCGRNPIPGLLEARLEALWYVQWDGLG